MTAVDPASDPARPLGPPVVPVPARRPDHIVHAGRYIDLEPLDAARHAEALWAGTRGQANHDLWTYLFDGPFESLAALRADLARKAASKDPLFWAIVDRSSGLAQGYATLMRIEPAHRVIEIGNILFTPALQRTRGATEVIAIMAGIVFDDLAYRRFEWKCNALNAPSRAAALRLGFGFEGIFRQHMIAKGRNRDTAWFSMLDADYPLHRRAFALWLDPENFDAAGRQRSSLGQCRARAAAEMQVSG